MVNPARDSGTDLDFEYAYLRYNRPQNDDPTNEYMYHVPLENNNGGHEGNKGNKEGDGDTYVTNQSQPLDLKALHQRLQVLGLNPHFSESLIRQPDQTGPHPALGSAFKTNPISRDQPFSPPETARSQYKPVPGYQPFSPPFEHDYHTHPSAHRLPAHETLSPPIHKPPTAIELGPSDSLSQMYRPYRGSAESVRSHRMKGTRRGGTNVDPVDGHGVDYTDEYEDEHNSEWETRNVPPSDAPSLEEMTMGRTEWAGEAGDMLDMRERLLTSQQAQQAQEFVALNQHITDASTLAAALAKLETTQDQLRTLQATLIAERVARTQIERRSHEGEDDVREVKAELAGAVRALRRAKEEAKRNEEEKRRLARCFEETKVQLYKYHEELRVRDARSKGREEGRAEAWQEAERWMGQSPPIPVDPIQSVPQAVLRHTPMPGHQALPQQHPGDNPAMRTQAPSTSPRPHPRGQQSFGQAVQRSDAGMALVPHGEGHHPNHQQQQHHQQPPHAQQHGDQHQHQQPGMNPQPQQTGATIMPGPMPSMPPPQGMQQQTIYQPIMVPVSMPQLPQQQHFPPQPPQSQNIPRSAPHRSNPLPSYQSERHNKAATVIGRSPHPPSHQGHQRSATLGSMSLHPPAPDSVPQHHAAESYLDRIDHDPHVQSMLHDTRSKTVHTSGFSDRPPQTARSVSAPTEKPLPTPGTHTPGRAVSQAHTARPTKNGANKAKSQRYSMLEQLHGHPRNESALNDWDRYPVFPHHQQQHQGERGHHSRNDSFNSIDPAGIALPHSIAGSALNTPQTKISKRSKVAGALRGGTEIDDLSDIQEDEREARRSHYAGQHQHEHHGAPNGAGEYHMSHNMPQMQHQRQAPQSQKKQNYAPSMPPIRNRPVPRMPQQLGANKAPSEPHAPPKQDLSNFFHRHTHHHPDPTVAMLNSMPEPTSDKPARTHDLYDPPGMASQAVHGSVMDIQGPRTSALGLEGLDDQAQHRHQGSSGPPSGAARRERAGTMGSTKAPTIMIQSPSTQNKSRPDTMIQSAKMTPRVLQDKTPNHTHLHNQAPPPMPMPPTVDVSQAPTKRQTMVITEYYDSPPHHHPAPHMFPLPVSRPHAPTVYSTFSPDRVLSPPERHSSGDKLPSVSVIDYALRQALPDSRPTTVMSVLQQKVTVASEPDIDDPPRKTPTPKQHFQAKRKPTPNHIDPRHVPLPASRAPTHRPRTSTYAGTVATIDEVTEEESAKENRSRMR